MKTKGERTYKGGAFSNFDHSFEHGLEETTKIIIENPDNYFDHNARNFCAYIWFENNIFYEEVWVYRNHSETLKSESLRDLITKTNDIYGYA
jgi:hypothetical protein